MVTGSVVAPAIAAAAIALPDRMVLHDVVVQDLAKDVGIALLGSFVHVYRAAELGRTRVARRSGR